MLSHEIVKAFAKLRNEGLNFSFLKENGELLQIAATSGMKMESQSLGLYQDMYGNVLKLCELYPPFYRFFLAITLDLEALGMPGHMGEALTDYVINKNLFDYETSDTRRWEILNLLERTEREPKVRFDTRAELEKRAHGFFNTPDQYTKFNRPIFYEFTHIIFFWTNYGKTPFSPTPELLKSLTYIGLLSYLDDDFDLLAEVCMCFKFVGKVAPEPWICACEPGLNTLKIEFHDRKNISAGSIADEYHIYLVLNWFLKQFGKEAFVEKFERGVPFFTKKAPTQSALSALSQVLHKMTLLDKRTPLAPKINSSSCLSEIHHKKVGTAIASTPYGEEFFSKHTQNLIVYR